MNYQQSLLELRLLNKISQTESCWLWMAARDKNGYGKLKLDGRMAMAHRMAYTVWVGEIPPKRLVLHTCDTPACINPDHLFVGTHTDNARDRRRKGRGPIGVRNNAKLTESEVRAIRDLSHIGEYAQIARLFKVSEMTVARIVKRHAHGGWAHLD